MERPNPDELLANIKAQEDSRGKLKIFFGAVAGVGKTYSMLEEAQHKKKEGLDIVIGYVEPHKRPETEILLEGLEVIPPKIIQYKSVQLKEFDVDAALKRNPKIILVDELAHSNAQGSRHLKRWQDIEELLDKGIDVYTTLNVQHCESANDIVTHITGIKVHETVPDTFVDKANEIELIDLPSEDLLKRLKDGKVYLGQQAALAAHNFFQPGNLIALRQLALRYTSRNVDAKMQSYKKANSISKVWQVRDKFLVCISSNPNALQLIRAGKRISSEVGVEWIVACVETPIALSLEDKNRISEMLRFAESLGAEVITLIGQDVAETLISYARSKNITKIIVGKPGKKKLREIFFGSVIDELSRKCKDIDLYLLSEDTQAEKIKSSKIVLDIFPWKGLVSTISLITICTIINKFLFSYLELVNLVMIYLLVVTLIAFLYGRRMSMISSFLSVVCFDYFFIPPYFSFAVGDFEYIITFVIMLSVGFVIGHLTGQLRRQTILMRNREDRMQALYALNKKLAQSSYPDELFKIVHNHIQEFFKCETIVFIPDAKKKLTVLVGKTKDTDLYLKEESVAQWVYEHKKVAGKNTDTLPGVKGIYLPFIGLEKTVGVIGVFTTQDRQFLDPEQFHMLELFVKQAALAIEGAQLAKVAFVAESNIENERLRNLLLTTFSYDLLDPIKSITQILSELEENNDEAKRIILIQDMKKNIEILNASISELPKIIQ